MEVIVAVVRLLLDKQSAVHFIQQKAKEYVSEEDQQKFIEVVETELQSLHKGNIARYRLRFSEYDEWQKRWK
jgi:hypothetical protein